MREDTRRMPKGTPSPMPILAPVERPLLEEESWFESSGDLAVAVEGAEVMTVVKTEGFMGDAVGSDASGVRDAEKDAGL